MIKLGQEVKDSITGFKGTVIAKYIYLTGYIQFNVQPKIKSDDTIPDTVWFDESRLSEDLTQTAPPGGSMDTPRDARNHP